MENTMIKIRHLINIMCLRLALLLTVMFSGMQCAWGQWRNISLLEKNYMAS